jgi:mercuric ion transport protein
MWRDKTVRFGVIGAVVVALCCFTPILVILLAAVGLSWAVGYLDYVLFPALFIFIGLTIYAVWRRQRATALNEERSEHSGDIRF